MLMIFAANTCPVFFSRAAFTTLKAPLGEEGRGEKERERKRGGGRDEERERGRQRERGGGREGEGERERGKKFIFRDKHPSVLTVSLLLML